MSRNLLTLTIGKQKNIALIAHDAKKEELISWCDEHKELLSKHFLCGTGTTARMITDRTGLPVKGYNSGPLGGDQQIGAKIVEGRIDFVIFFSDPLTAAPHDPDVKALLRVAQVYDIPIANNRATADFMITSPLMDQEYDHDVIDFQRNIAERAKTLQENKKQKKDTFEVNSYEINFQKCLLLLKNMEIIKNATFLANCCIFLLLPYISVLLKNSLQQK